MNIPFYYRPYRVADWRAVDGDTIHLWIDLGEKIYLHRIMRLDGIDVPETRSSNEVERAAAQFVTAKVADWLRTVKEGDASCYVVSNVKPDKFGRMLGDITVLGASLAGYLLGNGYARHYSGGTRAPWTTEELKKILESGSIDPD